MLKSEELMQKLTNLISEVKDMQEVNKIDEAHAKLSEIENVKKEIEVAKAIEAEEIQEVENKVEKGEILEMVNLEVLNKEEKVFANYIRTAVSNGDMKAGDNGAIIPVTIASRIIERVSELAPIYEKATKFNVGGDLVFAKEATIPTTAYVEEMATVTASTATFATVKLQAFVAGALTKISKSLINRADFDLVSYVVEAIAKSVAEFLEKELILGTANKMEGLVATTNKVVTASATAITADEIIDLQMGVKQALQGGCEFLMNPATLKALRKLKDGDGTYLLQKDVTQGFGYVLLGKPVVLSDNMPVIGAGKDVIVYGDFSGLYVKLAQNVEISVLNEKYADQFAVGVLAHVEVDSKIVEDQKLVKLTCKA